MKPHQLFRVWPLAAIVTLACTLALPEAAYAEAPGLQGVWNARVEVFVCNTTIQVAQFDAMSLFSADGTFLDTNSVDPQLKSASFGTWEHLRGRTYRFDFRFFRFDAMGMGLGSQIVRHTIALSLDGESYTSAGTAEFYDADGNLLMTACSRSTATRFH